MSVYHTPVLLEESVQLLAVEPQGTYADLTFGGGGHSRRILAELGDGGRLFASCFKFFNFSLCFMIGLY